MRAWKMGSVLYVDINNIVGKEGNSSMACRHLLWGHRGSCYVGQTTYIYVHSTADMESRSDFKLINMRAGGFLTDDRWLVRYQPPVSEKLPSEVSFVVLRMHVPF